MSFEEAYGLLCGKSLRFDHVYGIVEMDSEDDVLRVSGQAMGHDVSWQRQLWLSEFALAYNLLSPPLPR